MRKQFHLDYYLEHPDTKVVTREGRNARILCTDLQEGVYPIAAAVFNISGDVVKIDVYTSEGMVVANTSFEHSRDLFFDLPEHKKKRVPLTYVDLLERVKANKTMWVTDNDGVTLQIVEFGDSGWFATGSYNEHKNTLLMEQGMYFADGTPCWKEVEE